MTVDSRNRRIDSSAPLRTVTMTRQGIDAQITQWQSLSRQLASQVDPGHWPTYRSLRNDLDQIPLSPQQHEEQARWLTTLLGV